MKDNIIKDVQIKVLGNVENDLKSYDLPITIQSVAIEEGDSQIVTVKFVDQNKKKDKQFYKCRMMENKSHMWGIENEENRLDIDKNTMAYYFDCWNLFVYTWT